MQINCRDRLVLFLYMFSKSFSPSHVLKIFPKTNFEDKQGNVVKNRRSPYPGETASIHKLLPLYDSWLDYGDLICCYMLSFSWIKGIAFFPLNWTMTFYFRLGSTLKRTGLFSINVYSLFCRRKCNWLNDILHLISTAIAVLFLIYWWKHIDLIWYFFVI